MDAALELDRLPAALRPLVARGLTDDALRPDVIDQLRGHLERSDARPPEVLVALALLRYRDAAEVMLHELGEASREALALVEEAQRTLAQRTLAQRTLAQRTVARPALDALRAQLERTVARERARERRLSDLALDPTLARPTELIELAHLVLARGDDDGRAADLMTTADLRERGLLGPSSEPEEAAFSFSVERSGIFRAQR
ncbi:MAG: hypothetical protein VYE22_34135 [Myxococcota bacterium]|nr:hypothetical protein [Myxococcota bacterium]